MPLTTIKVHPTVRDRLAAVARAQGTTMGALLEATSRRLEAEQRWAEIEASCEQLRRDDPDGWHSYMEELSELSVSDADASAADEWPEYNR